ncbi:MAG: alpha/beta hydrolase [Hymenobacteraceae bacterium]|nr:alpha/beta hydrolase [Hymenobacteraceae bacterium]
MKNKVFSSTTKALYLWAIFTFLFYLPLQQAKAQKQQPSSFKVEVTGKGKPMILIPGLTCSGEVWNETVARYKNDYQCHVLTLAGFAGQPAVQADKFLETVRNELAVYIRQQKLNKPLVIGHSLGGFLGLWLGAKEPDLVGGLVIIDSAPFLPALINPAITAEGAKAMAETMINNMRGQTKEQLQQTQPQMLRSMITDDANIAKAAEWGYTSDGNTVAKAIYELYTTDLRNDLASIKAPTLVMAAWIAYKPYGTTHESTKLNFQNQYRLLPNYELVVNDKAKHFIMWDDPEGFYAAMDNFISKTGDKPSSRN